MAKLAKIDMWLTQRHFSNHGIGGSVVGPHNDHSVCGFIINEACHSKVIRSCIDSYEKLAIALNKISQMFIMNTCLFQAERVAEFSCI